MEKSSANITMIQVDDKFYYVVVGVVGVLGSQTQQLFLVPRQVCARAVRHGLAANQSKFVEAAPIKKKH